MAEAEQEESLVLAGRIGHADCINGQYHLHTKVRPCLSATSVAAAGSLFASAQRPQDQKHSSQPCSSHSSSSSSRGQSSVVLRLCCCCGCGTQECTAQRMEGVDLCDRSILSLLRCRCAAAAAALQAYLTGAVAVAVAVAVAAAAAGAGDQSRESAFVCRRARPATAPPAGPTAACCCGGAPQG